MIRRKNVELKKNVYGSEGKEYNQNKNGEIMKMKRSKKDKKKNKNENNGI